MWAHTGQNKVRKHTRTPPRMVLHLDGVEIRGKVLSEVGRIWVIIDQSGNDGIKHRDHTIPDVLNEFIWLRTGNAKSIVVYPEGNEADPCRCVGHAGWFDPRLRHQAVCSDSSKAAISIRIDGRFTPAAKEAIGSCSIWTSADGN